LQCEIDRLESSSLSVYFFIQESIEWKCSCGEYELAVVELE